MQKSVLTGQVPFPFGSLDIQENGLPPEPPVNASICSPCSRGFTLTELLVALGVLSMLVALVMGASSRSQKAAVQAACQANLRSVGTAILLYTTDNNQKLPFNANVSVSSYYQRVQGETEPGGLGGNLAPYLGLPSPNSVPAMPAKQDVKVLSCPAHRNATANSVSYIVNCTLASVPRQRPFGAGEYSSSEAVPPVSLLTVASAGQLSKIWALMDVDQQVTYTPVKGSGWFDELPEKPIHGSSRNCLFFDGHVEAVSKLP